MGTDKKMERQAALLSVRKKFASAFSKERSEDGSTRKLGKVFCLTAKFMDEERFGRGETRADSPLAVKSPMSLST